MFRIRRGHRKFTFFLVFFATISLFLNSFAVAGGEGVHGGSHEGAHESSAEGVHEDIHEGEHGKDRRGDLLDLLYRFINFALLVIILFVAIRKSGLKDSLTGRIEEIKQRLEDLRKEKEETESKYRNAERKLRDFEGERKDIIEEFKKEGYAEREKIIAEAKERVKGIIEQAELSIQHEMQSARDRLRGEVVDLAAQKAQELLAKEITDKDQDQLVSEFIEKVGKIH